jgi:hypothetical protein
VLVAAVAAGAVAVAFPIDAVANACEYGSGDLGDLGDVILDTGCGAGAVADTDEDDDMENQPDRLLTGVFSRPISS